MPLSEYCQNLFEVGPCILYRGITIHTTRKSCAPKCVTILHQHNMNYERHKSTTTTTTTATTAMKKLLFVIVVIM